MWIFIGFLGSFLVLLAWILGLVDELRSKKNLIEIKFSFITLVGVIFLLIYSFLKGEWPFIILNLGLLLMIIFEVLYSMKIERTGKK